MAASPYLHTPKQLCAVCKTVHPRRAQEAVYRGVKGPTSNFVNQHALNSVVEGLRRLPRRVGRTHHWLVRHSSHLVVVPLEEPYFAAAHARAPSVHLTLLTEHTTILVPDENGVLEPHVLSMCALQVTRGAAWDALVAHTRAHMPLAGAHEVVPLGAVEHGSTHLDMVHARDSRLPTM